MAHVQTYVVNINHSAVVCPFGACNWRGENHADGQRNCNCGRPFAIRHVGGRIGAPQLAQVEVITRYDLHRCPHCRALNFPFGFGERQCEHCGEAYMLKAVRNNDRLRS